MSACAVVPGPSTAPHPAPEARSREFLYQHDQGMARVRKHLEKRARDQVRDNTAAAAE
jgi:hypothetical protein